MNGGRLISVKSTQLLGVDAQAAIQAWVDDLANFNVVGNVSVVNPSCRTLMVAVQTPLDAATAAAVRAYANGRGVTVEMFTNLPPNHPAVVFPDTIPEIMGEAGVVAATKQRTLKSSRLVKRSNKGGNGVRSSYHTSLKMVRHSGISR